MEFSFNNILYDNSARRPKDMPDEDYKRESYPGLSMLTKKLKETYQDGFEWEKNSGKIQNKVSFAIRYRNCGKEGKENSSWGGVDTTNEMVVYAITKSKDGFRIYITNTDFIKEKIKDRTGDSKSWGISQDDNIKPFEVESFVKINEKIVEDLASKCGGEK